MLACINLEAQRPQWMLISRAYNKAASITVGSSNGIRRWIQIDTRFGEESPSTINVPRRSSTESRFAGASLWNKIMYRRSMLPMRCQGASLHRTTSIFFRSTAWCSVGGTLCSWRKRDRTADRFAWIIVEQSILPARLDLCLSFCSSRSFQVDHDRPWAGRCRKNANRLDWIILGRLRSYWPESVGPSNETRILLVLLFEFARRRWVIGQSQPFYECKVIECVEIGLDSFSLAGARYNFSHTKLVNREEAWNFGRRSTDFTVSKDSSS